MNISCGIGALALSAVAVVGYGEDAERFVDACGSKTVSLDLSREWTMSSLKPVNVAYSSVGWDVNEAEGDATVTLKLAVGEAAASPLTEPLTGRGIYVWTPSTDVLEQACTLYHEVTRDASVDPAETLVAKFVFLRALQTVEEVAEAVFPDEKRSCEITGMSGANWLSLGSPGDGIAAPTTESSTLTFVADGLWAFDFDYRCSPEGVLTVAVDGGEPQALPPAFGWTLARIGVDTVGPHTMVVTASGDGTEIRCVRWGVAPYRFGSGRSAKAPADLREGVLVLRRTHELLPFTWSSTNFTGVVGSDAVDPASLASVRVVQVTGEGEDVSQWTTEVAGTEKMLVAEKQGEGTIRWKGVQQGVWKAELVIETNGSETYRETRILDLRQYVGRGMAFFLK